MKKINFTCIIIVFTFILKGYVSFAQSNDNLEYFPHDDSDMWEYFYSDGQLYTDTAQVFNHFDSTDADGNIFITQTSRYINPIQTPAIPFSDTMRYKIDTLNQVWAHFGEVEYGIAFKLDAKQGDQWVLKTYYDNGEVMGYEMARVNIIYEKSIFGEYFNVMNTFYYFAPDSTDTLGLDRYGVDLAKGLGVIWRGGGDSPGRMDIIGAVIDGILFGDTTNVLTSVESNNSSVLPSNSELRQNYPNPFNAGTNISFSLSKNINISIIIYNSNGEEVRKIIDNRLYSKGNYSSYWDGKDFRGQKVSSGVYFYSILENSIPTQTKNMLLLK